ncbi:group II truncated hemoglobin [Acidithiobacillus sp.]
MTEKQSPYECLGGEEGVRRLVDRFYDLMDSEAQWQSPLRSIHPEDLSGSRERLFLFLSGWLGGPDLYVERFGHPRLRARHASFPVDDLARDQWMACMVRAMDDVQVPQDVRGDLTAALQRTADFMRNR